jgi:outer membrane immunogenic protein
MKKLLISTTALIALTAAAGAADLPTRPTPLSPAIVAVPVFTWTGFYVGVNAGYGWSSNDNNGTVYNPATGLLLNGSGSGNGRFVGGGQIGYNYQIGAFVIGAETDIQYADVNHDRSFGGSSSHNGYFGTVRVPATPLTVRSSTPPAASPMAGSAPITSATPTRTAAGRSAAVLSTRSPTT